MSLPNVTKQSNRFSIRELAKKKPEITFQVRMVGKKVKHKKYVYIKYSSILYRVSIT